MATADDERPWIDSAALRSSWHPVAESTAVSSAPVSVRLLDEALVVWRDEAGRAVAAKDSCPHRQAPLSHGTVDGGLISCPYHGWTFDGAGSCVEIPSAGPDAAVPPTARLDVITTIERYGLVWAAIDPPIGELPLVTHDEHPAFRRIHSGFETWRVAATRMVDNFLDISHFPFVHRGTFGSAQDPRIEPITLGPLDAGWFGWAYEVDAANRDDAHATSGSDDAVVHRRMSTGFHLPLTVRSTIRYEDGLEHILLLCSIPVDATTSRFTFVVWRNDDHDADPQAAIEFDRAIGAEDRKMLERVPGALPLGRTALVNVQADRASVEWRRRFAEFLTD